MCVCVSVCVCVSLCVCVSRRVRVRVWSCTPPLMPCLTQSPDLGSEGVSARVHDRRYAPGDPTLREHALVPQCVCVWGLVGACVCVLVCACVRGSP